MFYCRFRSDPDKYGKEVFEALNTLYILSGNGVGGKDAVLQQKYRDLYALAAQAAKVESAGPGARRKARSPGREGARNAGCCGSDGSGGETCRGSCPSAGADQGLSPAVSRT
jgi:hypothetical protein